MPVRYLVAAHIKRRSVCTPQEKRDIGNVAMAVCLFGCDILFETGAITVDETGHVIAAQGLDRSLNSFAAKAVVHRCLAHSPGAEPYFAWHRSNVFLGRGQETLPSL
jgi:hypothetical protein